MPQIKKDYYANEQGVQLTTFFEKVITPKYGFRFSLTQGFYLLSAFKYAVRAGYKPENPKEQDLEKIEDYVQRIAKHDEERFNPNGVTADDLAGEVKFFIDEELEAFRRFNGEEM